MTKAIDRIRIEGFKSIRQADIQLNALNILIGPNGAGKSNFIGLFKMVNSIIEQRLQLYVATAGGANNLLHFGRKRTPNLKIDITFSEAVNGYGCELTGNDDNHLMFSNEWTLFHDRNSYELPYVSNLGGGQLETNLHDGYGNPHSNIARYVMYAMQSWRIYHFHDTSPEAQVKQHCDLNDNRVLRGDASNLAAFLYLLKQEHPADYKSIVGVVKMVAPFLEDLVLEPLALNQQQIRLEWTEYGSDHAFGPNALSDGTLRFICLATLLLQPNLPSTILLDEPELGLHPYAITLLAEMLRNAASATQLIVSTQSVSLVNQFQPNDVLIVEREDGQSIFKRLEQDVMAGWLEDYGLGDLWEKNLLGGRP